MMKEQALTGIKVIEYSEFISGPYCGKLLADLGAEVIKVEKPGSGDRARSWGPFPQDLPHPEKSGLYLFLNTDKSGITLNLETQLGSKLFDRLIKWADVLIESSSPADVKKFGLGYRRLVKLNPALVVTSISPFGRSGPYKDYKGNDLIVSHMSSEAFGNPAEGVEDMKTSSPLKGPAHAADFMTGLTAGLSTLSAVLAQQASGGGQHVDVSGQEAVASVVRQELAFCMVEGLYPTRQIGRKRRGGMLYPCKDGYVCIWIGPHWPKLVQMMGNPDWAQDEIFANPMTRAEHMEDFNRLMLLYTLEHTAAEIEAASVAFDVPIAPVRSVKELVADDQLASRDFFVDIEHPEAGRLKYPGAPYKLSVTPWQVNRPAPLLGQHNEEI
jgi:crotonobetainyl-CoA:carnitine CoA-transferase CaiB-like acyl-CoA transferase